eukprot:NODE_182_length_3441_cov_5.433313.p1 GENE.NODE_182_length_3441_cov_5.433313~~NODE_182_length_3441_cov_5.433313.p1  ORF type:complete len:802 (+),score=172.22 NODE_182_length_3441_cov_5.433313:357-2408(+)
MAVLIATTAVEAGAVVCNYVNAKSLIQNSAGKTCGAICEDCELGAAGCEPFEVRAKVVVNATGPFTDDVMRMDGGDLAKPVINSASSTHIVLPDHFSPDRTGLSMLETSGGRAIYYLPWNGMTLVGSTERPCERGATLVPNGEDVDWILNEVNQRLNPNSKAAVQADVLSAWVGIRPTVAAVEDSGNSDPRAHVVSVSSSELVTVAGGIWTLYRLMAQEALQVCARIANLPAGLNPNAELGLVGSKAGANMPYKTLEIACSAPYYCEIIALRAQFNFAKSIAENLVKSYGTRAAEVASLGRIDPTLYKKIDEDYHWIMAQVVYACRREHAVSISDVLCRRIRLGQVDVLAAHKAVGKVADAMEAELGWTAERKALEVFRASADLKMYGLDHCLLHRLPAKPPSEGQARRAQMLARLRASQQKEFDILVIGGGATGLATALFAARRGYRVALVERNDYGCGTSSKSSNMIHGGIRYLNAFVKDPQGAAAQINLVKHGLAEQNYMYNTAPYMVRPCPFMVALYSEREKAEFTQLLQKYDELGADDPFPESRFLTKMETLYKFPQLKQEGLLGSLVYYDGQQDDARMALALALSAGEAGCAICNYINCTSLVKDGRGIVCGAMCQDVEPELVDSPPFKIRAKVVVNATSRRTAQASPSSRRRTAVPCSICLGWVRPSSARPTTFPR